MSASDTVFHKAALAEELRDARHVEIIDHWIGLERDREWGAAEFPPGWSGQQEADDQLSVLKASETFWVAPNMVELARVASESMPDEDLLPYDLPSTHGFMWLSQPFRMIDVRRKSLSMNAIMWAVRGGQVRVWHFTHRNDLVDSMNIIARSQLAPEHWQELPMFSLNHVANLSFGQKLPRGLTWDTPLPPEATMEFTDTKLEDGTRSVAFITDQSMDLDEEPKLIRSPLLAFLLTTWRLCQQSLAERERPPLNSKLRRRLRRANLPETPVTVITLRRSGYVSDGEGHVEWSHRWIVRGHWRKQPCKDRPGGDWTYRHVFIHPHIKGPDDKPLLVREHVNALTR